MQLKTLGIINKANIRRLKGEEGKVDRLGISGPKEQHSGKFSGVSSYLTYLGLGTGKVGTRNVSGLRPKKKRSQ